MQLTGAPSVRGRSGVAGVFKEMLNAGAKVEVHIDELLAGDSTAQPGMVYCIANHTVYNADGAVIEKGKSVLQADMTVTQYLV
jgi:hypothetical protein